MTKIPHDDILEGLYKLRIRGSEKLKTALELYDLETHQKKLGPDYQRLKTMLKRSIEQEIRESTKRCVFTQQHVEEYRTGTERPVLVDQKEEHEIVFRVAGLSHAVVKEAEHLRVQELVKKIDNHPHREAFHADLQQNNVYNKFSKNSKEMICEFGNVKFFELCGTIPKVQCSHRLLYWNHGIVYCTCGQCLIDSESRR